MGGLPILLGGSIGPEVAPFWFVGLVENVALTGFLGGAVGRTVGGGIFSWGSLGTEVAGLAVEGADVVIL